MSVGAGGVPGRSTTPTSARPVRDAREDAGAAGLARLGAFFSVAKLSVTLFDFSHWIKLREYG